MEFNYYLITTLLSILLSILFFLFSQKISNYLNSFDKKIFIEQNIHISNLGGLFILIPTLIVFT